MNDPTARLAARLAALSTTRARLVGDDGDVPGWVLVTVMTAGIAVALGAAAVPVLEGVFRDAMAAVQVGP